MMWGARGSFVDRLIKPLFWTAGGWVSSLNDLGTGHGVLARHDVVPAPGVKKSSLPVVELAGGKVIGDLRLAATSTDVVVGGVQAISGSDMDLANHYLLHRRRLRFPKRWHGTALLLGGAASDNYYHWLLESVPRWRLLQLAGYRNYDYVLLHSQPRRFQDEVLDRLGVPAEKRLRCAKNFVHQFDRLVIPAPAAPLWQFEAWICEWIRSLFTRDGDGQKKIYISRSDVRRRRLVNEPEIMLKLHELGFIGVQTEKLTVAEQAKLFGGASHIVAPHGAGLANLVFASPGTRLVELFHPDKRNLCYQNLAAACGHHYSAIVGTRVGPAARRDEQAEYAIDVSTLIDALQEGKESLHV